MEFPHSYEDRGRVLRPSQPELLRRYGLKLDKRLGQHFLVDRRILSRIVEAVEGLAPEHVIELASGAGALTFALADAGHSITSLELDPRMIELLKAETAGLPVDVQASDLAQEDFCRFADGRRLVFVGNLPYQVTSPVLFGLLPALGREGVAGAVVMVQAEVARRMVASPGGRDYGILSVLLQAQVPSPAGGRLGRRRARAARGTDRAGRGGNATGEGIVRRAAQTDRWSAATTLRLE